MTRVTFTVATRLCLLVLASAAFPPQIREVRVDLTGLSDVVARRNLQDGGTNASNTTDICSLCGNGTVVPDYVPIEPTEEFPHNLTCEDYAVAASFSTSEEECDDLKGLTPLCCSFASPIHVCETNVRRSLLAEYDAVTTPLQSYQQPLEVDVLLYFLTVTELDVRRGTAEIFVWLELTWKDPRLAWSLDDQHCASLVDMRASLNAETTEIWVPDFDLYNLVNGVQQFPDAMAHVQSDGTVRWRRGGELKAICVYKGLAQMPFDTLGCQLFFGAWNRLGFQHVKYNLGEGTGFVFGDFTPVYNEFKLLPDLVETVRRDLDVVYTFYFERATQYYVFNIVVPTTILTFVSFGTFLLDLRVGERLSFGMALALVMVAQQIITTELLPVSDERLWIDKFVGWSFYWVIFGLVESVIVGYIFFVREDLEPPVGGAATMQNTETMQNASIVADDGIPEEHTELRNDANGTSQEPQVAASITTTKPTLKQRLKMFKPRTTGNTPQRLPQWVNNTPLRKVDHMCFFFALGTYITYLIVMFATIPQWGKGVDPSFDLDE